MFSSNTDNWKIQHFVHDFLIKKGDIFGFSYVTDSILQKTHMLWATSAAAQQRRPQVSRTPPALRRASRSPPQLLGLSNHFLGSEKKPICWTSYGKWKQKKGAWKFEEKLANISLTQLANFGLNWRLRAEDSVTMTSMTSTSSQTSSVTIVSTTSSSVTVSRPGWQLWCGTGLNQGLNFAW